MAELEFELKLVHRRVDHDTVIAEALGFPEFSALGADEVRARRILDARVRKCIENLEIAELHQRTAPGKVALGELRIEIKPPTSGAAWTEPVTLRFDVLRWKRSGQAFVAFVPALGIHVLANKEEQLEQRLEPHVRFALQRTRKSTSLRELAQVERITEITVEDFALKAAVRSPRQVEANEEAESKKGKPVLEQVAANLNRAVLERTFEREKEVARLAGILGGREPRSVLIAGPSGCGKTALLHELIRTRAEHRLAGVRFWSTGGSQLVAGQSSFGGWQEQCRKLCHEAAREKVVLHLGNLAELANVGQSVHNQQSIASFLRPYIGRGDLLVVAEATPEQIAVIERDDPHLLTVFQELRLLEPDARTGLAILRACAEHLSAGRKPIIEDAALDTLDRLHRRYATYSASPGRPLRFLKNLVRDRAEPELPEVAKPKSPKKRNRTQGEPKVTLSEPVSSGDVVEAFSRETGLPRFMLDDSIPLNLGETRTAFSGQVIGQDKAVELVVELMATVKAQLSRPKKPLASLLFIGPTGVGKTEMAKCLAGFLFGNRDRLTRFDMSEFGNESAVLRLIGGCAGEGLLTAKVREQPFSVLLLDEFEKADPALFDLLLQVLGEGRLTDAAGRVADFRNAVIVMTSNLGAETWRQDRPGFAGFSDTSVAAGEHFTSEVRKFFRPEFFNRIDRIVPFAPLNDDTVLRITRREIERIKQRDGVRLRRIVLDIDEPAIRHLAETGFDPRYGARPLKRVIERELLAPFAHAVNDYSDDTALDARISFADGRIGVDVRSRPGEGGRMLSVRAGDSPLADLAAECTKLRRNAQRLRTCAVVWSLEDTRAFLESLERRLAKRKWTSSEDGERLGKLPGIKAVIRSLDAHVGTTIRLEQDVALAIYEEGQVDRQAAGSQLNRAAMQWRALLEETFWYQFKRPDVATLAVFGPQAKAVWRLAGIYRDLATAFSLQARASVVLLPARKQDPIRRETAGDLSEVLKRPNLEAQGLFIELSGRFAWPRFEHENRLYRFQADGATLKARVFAGNERLADCTIPAALEKAEWDKLMATDRYRTCDHGKEVVDDFQLGRREWKNRRLEQVLEQMLEERFDQALKELVA